MKVNRDGVSGTVVYASRAPGKAADLFTTASAHACVRRPNYNGTTYYYRLRGTADCGDP
jgi:hypothetical protein